MKRIILLSGLGLATYLFFVIASAPAAFVLNFLPDRSDYRIQGPSGTLWDGRVESVQVGPVRISALSWELKPGRLLTGQADAELRADVAGGNLTGRIQARSNGNITVSQAMAQDIDISALAPLFQPPADTATGEAMLRIESLSLRNGKPVNGAGQIRVFDLGINAMGQHRLGTYAGDFSGEEGQFTVTFSDAGEQAPFDVEGRLDYGVDSGEYTLEGRIRALPDASESLSGALSYLGDADDDGFRQVQTSGRVRPNPF